MTNNLTNIFNLLLAWLLYFAAHSALASLSVKNWAERRWPRFVPYYRLAYNLVAVVLLVPPLWLAHGTRAAPLWAWHGAWGWVADGLALGALAGFWWSLRYYDMGEFLGLSQARNSDHGRRFSLSPLHRFVRHPWYCFGLVIIWTRDMNAAWLTSCVLITLYFIVGSRLEERKLVAEFGDAYRRYRQRVPALLPLPGRYLSRSEAEKIISGPIT